MRRRTTWALCAVTAAAAIACSSGVHDRAATNDPTDTRDGRTAGTGDDAGEQASQAWRVAPDQLALDLLHDGDLDATQERELLGIRSELARGWEQVHAASSAAASAMDAELAGPSPDAAKLHTLADQALAAYATLTRETTRHVLELIATLAPAQRALLASRHADGVQRAVVKRDVVRVLTASAQPDAPKVTAPSDESLEHNLQPYQLGLELQEPGSTEARQVRKQLHRDLRVLRRTLAVNVKGALADLSGGARDDDALRACVERALAGYARATHASIDEALRLHAAHPSDTRLGSASFR